MRGGLRPPVLDAILYALRAGCAWRLLPREYPSPLQPRLAVVYADGAYAGAHLRNGCAAHAGVELRVVRRPGTPQAAPPLRRDPEKVDRGLRPPERTFAWLGRNRRLAKDCEARPQTTEVLMAVGMIGPMLRRLAPRC